MTKTIAGLSLLSVLSLLSACGGPDATETMDRALSGTWAGSCTEVTQGHQQPQITFASGRIEARNVLFADPFCTEFRRTGQRVTLGTYIERGSGPTATPIDIQIDGVEDDGHLEVLPRAYDVYQIENGLLSFGLYTTGDGSSADNRPLATGNQALTRLNDGAE